MTLHGSHIAFQSRGPNALEYLAGRQTRHFLCRALNRLVDTALLMYTPNASKVKDATP
jgi:hypothetical protein